LQKLNTNTKLQKLKGRQNTKIIAETDEIPNFAEAEDKISLQKIFAAPCKPPANSPQSWIRELVLGIKPRFIKPALIPC